MASSPNDVLADGLSSWVPRGGTASRGPSVYVWVDDGGQVQVHVANLVDDRDRINLAARCDEYLRGAEPLGDRERWRDDLEQHVALVAVSADGIGVGSLFRTQFEPLKNLLEAAKYALIRD